jgi:hypothetical protein
LSEAIQDEPALVLVESGHEGAHLDFVINAPGLAGSPLLGRYRTGRTDLAAVARAFPDRTVYLCRPEQRELVRVRRSSDD